MILSSSLQWTPVLKQVPASQVFLVEADRATREKPPHDVGNWNKPGAEQKMNWKGFRSPGFDPMEASLLPDVSDARHHPHSGVERVSVETEHPYIVTP
jgi:hypothetical protein